MSDVPPPPYPGLPPEPDPVPTPSPVPRPAPADRFSGSSVAWGVLLSLLLPVVWLPLSVIVASGVTNASTNGAVAVFLLLLLVPCVPGALLAARGKSPSERGMGLGLLIGWSLIAIIGGGLCVSLVAQLN